MYQKGRQLKTPAESKISLVTLALQLSSGERLLKEFEPNVTLWDILEHWDQEGKLEPSLKVLKLNQVPTCIYLRKELSSEEQLKATSLLDLGITNGKVAIRYNVKSDEIKEQPHVGGILPRAVRPESPPVGQKQKGRQAQPDVKHQSAIEAKPIEGEINITMKQEAKTQQNIVQLLDQDSKIHEQSTSTDEAMEEEVGASSNFILPQTTSVRMTSSTIQLMEESCSTDICYLNKRDGHLLYQRPDNDLALKRTIGYENEADDFFEVTESEVRKMLQDLIRENHQHQNAPLVTSQIRQNQEEERRIQFLKKYPITIIRVQFTDGLILQMPLPSHTHLSQVKKDLLPYLTEELKLDVHDFVLFTSPPKEVLKEDLPLHRLGLTPSSLVYIGSSNSSKICSNSLIIKSESRQSISSYFDAVKDATKRFSSSQQDCFISNQSSTSTFNLPTTSSDHPCHLSSETEPRSIDDGASGTTKRSAFSSTSDIPKWLKLNR